MMGLVAGMCWIGIVWILGRFPPGLQAWGKGVCGLVGRWKLVGIYDGRFLNEGRV